MKVLSFFHGNIGAKVDSTFDVGLVEEKENNIVEEIIPSSRSSFKYRKYLCLFRVFPFFLLLGSGNIEIHTGFHFNWTFHVLGNIWEHISENSISRYATFWLQLVGQFRLVQYYALLTSAHNSLKHISRVVQVVLLRESTFLLSTAF